jgi:septal ring factor EnvC (AmiA/AmiB activator)
MIKGSSNHYVSFGSRNSVLRDRQRERERREREREREREERERRARERRESERESERERARERGSIPDVSSIRNQTESLASRRH